MGHEHKVVCDFASSPMLRWSSVDDAVMGGVSESLMRISDEGIGIFSGSLSLENNGGFASVRTSLPDNDFRDFSAFFLHVRGDGRRYSFRVRTDLLFDGIVYKHDFDTVAATWLDIRLPFSDFIPSFRGRSVPDAPPIDPSAIYQIGFLISDRQAGNFMLEVDAIEACL